MERVERYDGKEDDDDEGGSEMEEVLSETAALLSSSSRSTVPELSLGGLTTVRAKERLAQDGPNELPSDKVPLWKRLLKHLFATPISLLIWLAIIVSGLVQDWIDFGLVLFLQLGNTALTFHEQGKAGAALDALQAQIAPHTCVLRDGNWVDMAARELVAGDVIRFGIGDAIPADCILVSEGCQVDESALTGESLPCNRKRGDPIFSGSFCTKGSSMAIVEHTGTRTKFGRQHALIASAQQQLGHFERILRKISYTLVGGALLVIVAIVIMQFASGRRQGLAGVMDVASLALVLLIAALPVALVAVSTTTMALAARRLASEDGVICTKLSAIQDLACMTTLCSDKTGTLTLNELHLTDPWIANPAATTKEELFLLAALCSDYTSPHRDAIDSCIVSHASVVQPLKDWEQSEFVPFEPALKRTEATCLHRVTKRRLRVSKGSPQTLLALGRFDASKCSRVNAAVDELASKGYRSLGVMSMLQDGHSAASWHFDGIISLYDPPRKDAHTVIQALQHLGVEVKMVSGDHRAIVQETCSLLKLKPVVMHVPSVPSDVPYQECNAFAEVFPEQKHSIVSELQQEGTQVIGMTGDGLNDASALRKADIGIAVAGSSDAARAAADMALSQPGLAPIVNAIIRARVTFERLRNYISFRIAISINVLLSSLLLLIFYDFQLPSLSIVFHIILMDLTVLMTAKDKVNASLKPCEWRLAELAVVSVGVGIISVMEVCSVYWLAGQASFFYSSTLSQDELRALVYLTLAIGSQLCIFVVRTRTLFFSRRPGWGLLLAVLVGAVVATIISMFASSIMIGFKAILFRDVLCTMCILVVGFLIKDISKYVILMAFDSMRRSDKQNRKLEHILRQVLVGK